MTCRPTARAVGAILGHGLRDPIRCLRIDLLGEDAGRAVQIAGRRTVRRLRQHRRQRRLLVECLLCRHIADGALMVVAVPIGSQSQGYSGDRFFHPLYWDNRSQPQDLRYARDIIQLIFPPQPTLD